MTLPPPPRDHVLKLAPYEWEASASEVAAAAGIPESDVLRFDTNTASWPPVAWEQTVRDVERMPANEYPHPSNEPLRSALASRLGVPPEQVVVTCGADEALQLLATVYLAPGSTAVVADPSFAMFRVVTEGVGARVVRVPVDECWDLPLEPLLEAVHRSQAHVVWLCSPSNPTGRSFDATFLSRLARGAPASLIVLDEAYYEIAGVTLAPTVLEHPNAVVVRTFSKGYGLAGARVGYMTGHPDVIRHIESVRLPQNLSIFGLTAACRALADQPGLEQRVAAIRVERAVLAQALVDRGWEIVPSDANFILTRPRPPARALAAWLQSGGIIVRSYSDHPRLGDWLRMTVRSPEEDARLLARIDAFPSGP